MFLFFSIRIQTIATEDKKTDERCVVQALTSCSTIKLLWHWLISVLQNEDRPIFCLLSDEELATFNS